MAKKITLEAVVTEMRKGFASLDGKIDSLHTRMERGFAAVAEDISKLATKEQPLELQSQVNSIEQQLRETKIEVRLGVLEDKVFGAPRR